MTDALVRNANGVLLGTIGNVTRVAAFLFEVPATSKPRKNSHGLKRAIYEYASGCTTAAFAQDITYLVYVERLSPPTARCQCEDFLVTGNLCKHGELAVAAAKFFKDLDPEQYQDELDERLDRRANRNHKLTA